MTSRRSQRLAIGGYHHNEDDGGSSSSAGSVAGSQVTYREIPVKIFKRKSTSRRTTPTPRYGSSTYSAESLTTYNSEPLEESTVNKTYWETQDLASSDQRKAWNINTKPYSSLGGDALGNSSGYSSSEEGHIGDGPAEAFGNKPLQLKDVLFSPGNALRMIYWWLGTAWYSLTTGASLLDVFVLTRYSAALKKGLLAALLLLLIGLGGWYMYPWIMTLRVPKFFNQPVKTKVPSESMNKVYVPQQDTSTLSRLAALEQHLSSLSSEKGALYQKIDEFEQELVKNKEETMRMRAELWNKDKVAVQIQEARLKDLVILEEVQAKLAQIKSSFQSHHSQDFTSLVNKVVGLEREIGSLRAEMSEIQGSQMAMRGELSAVPKKMGTIRSQLLAEIEELLKRNNPSRPSDSDPDVIHNAELQRALLDLERKILDRVAKDKKGSDVLVSQTVGATLQGAGIAGITKADEERIVQRALNLFRADGIGMVDYALESAGASVINTRCSETYETKSALISLFGIPLWYQSQSPRVVIQPDVHPGNCWAFRGSHGFIVIELASQIQPTAVTLEHIPKSISPQNKIDSAPREFAVYGLKNESQKEGTLLGSFAFDQDGEPLQTFYLSNEENNIYGVMELRVLSNWGNPEYTCVYRFRVHGELAS
ncbi:SUN domain-containing protein 2 [Erpetoichthys calabaricus]|uniref:SUN domain-containing protein 2 n=1 Tax=Erpetoichthys calabaricus TaxID=27687 RepID=UPI00223498B0|nr:SUN domain-containing protein 2 [Erpetoichthys calabaricus]